MTQVTTPAPGIYQDVPFEDYVQWQAVNQSSLSIAMRSWAHYRWWDGPTATADMTFGNLVHCGKLEPAALAARYAVRPRFEDDIRKPDGTEYSNVKATKAYKDAVETWRATIGDREECTQDELDRMIGMASALTSNDLAREWLNGPGRTEVSLVWQDPDTGILCKGRIDKVRKTKALCLIADLKTSRDALEFERSIAKYGYHRQAAFYIDGFAALSQLDPSDVQYGVVVVEKESPYGVRSALMSQNAISIGRAEYKQLLIELAECRRTDLWPGYRAPEFWDLPAWYAPAAVVDEELGLTVRGEMI